MRELSRISPDVRAQSCPTTPPPYKRGTAGGSARIGNCVVPDCCNCCNKPPPVCLGSPQEGFIIPNCCELCTGGNNSANYPIFKGIPTAKITGTGCLLDGNWTLGCFVVTEFVGGPPDPSGDTSFFNQSIPWCQTSSPSYVASITVRCNNKYRPNTIFTPPRPFPAQQFNFIFGAQSLNILVTSGCFSSGVVDSTNASDILSPVTLTGTCYPLNLTGKFYLYATPAWTPGCPSCGCGTSGNVTITTTDGGF